MVLENTNDLSQMKSLNIYREYEMFTSIVQEKFPSQQR